jgi:4a-hydroxytetrahydrobiopterin dehydratase
MTTFTKLNETEIANHLTHIPEWHMEGNQLVTDYVFKNFLHPTWTNTYNRVSIKLSTHDAENSVTDLDFKLAQYISETAKRFVA